MTLCSIGKTYMPIAGCQEHAHEEWEVILNISGAGDEYINRKCRHFQKGSIVCIPPQVPHYKIGDGLFEDIHFRVRECTLFEGDHPFFTLDDEFRSIEKLMEWIHYAWYRDEKHLTAGTGQLLNALLQILKERIPQAAQNPYIEHIHRVIIQRFTDPEFVLSAELARAPYCADYLRRLYSEAYHTTPQQYLLRLRMEKAEEILRNSSDRPIAEVALQCGFYDAHYFSRLFRTRFGCTPSEYVRRPAAAEGSGTSDAPQC